MEAEVPRRTALIIYGTETGNAQDIAEELGQLAERLRFSTRVAELDDVEPNELHFYLITVFVVSTTGQGDFPSDARRFWRSLLRKKLSSTFLRNVSYFLVGLGDSSYPKFNWAARKLEKRLNQLGAFEIIEACEADEQGPEGTDGPFIAWLPLFKAALNEHFSLPEGLNPIPDKEALPAQWTLKQVTSVPQDADGDVVLATAELNGNLPKSGELAVGRLDNDRRPIPQSFQVVLGKNERVTPTSHWQDVRFLTLTNATRVDYLPGDALSVLPKNFPNDVNDVIQQMRWIDVADVPLMFCPNSSIQRKEFSANYPPCPIPFLNPLSEKQPPFTLRSLLTDYLDITAIPRRSFFGRLALYTENLTHKERLLEFTQPQYLDEYYDYATRARRSILEILQEFESVRIPWWEAANVFPPLRGRSFSIASGGDLKSCISESQGKAAPELLSQGRTKFELLVAIVEYRTVIRKVRRGVCTRYLASLRPGSTLNVVLKTDGRLIHTSKGHRPKHATPNGAVDHSTHPLPTSCMSRILIGTGTGVAPLRAIIHHDEEQERKSSEPQHELAVDAGKIEATRTTTPTSTLFFGARNESQDFFFKDEWLARVASSQDDKFNRSATKGTATDAAISSYSHQPCQLGSCRSFNLITAFSRDQPDSAPTAASGRDTFVKKLYIQHQISTHSSHIFDLMMRQNATIIVCGSSGAMPRGVRAALADCLVIEGEKQEKDQVQNQKLSKEDGRIDDGREQGRRKWTWESANQYLDKLEKDGRYLQETW